VVVLARHSLAGHSIRAGPSQVRHERNRPSYTLSADRVKGAAAWRTFLSKSD
jgi:hypothetical protein